VKQPGRLVGNVHVGAFVVAIVALLFVGLPQVDVRTDLDSLLPSGDPALSAYQDASERFGGDPIVVLLEDNARSDDVYLDQRRLPLVLQLEGALSELEGVTNVYGPGTLLNQIAGRAQDFLAELTGRRDAEIALAQERARARGGGRAAIEKAGQREQTRFDARYGPLLVEGLPGGLPTLSNQDFVQNVMFGDAGEPRGQWRFLVPSRASVAILVRPQADLDAADSARLVEEIRRLSADIGVPNTEVTISGVPVLVSGLSERAEHDAPILGFAAVVVIACFLMLAVWLPRRRRLVPLATTLVAVAGALAFSGLVGIPVSLGVIAFCPVLLGIGCYYPTYLAVGASVRTVLAVAAATALSLLSLSLSPLPLVGDLGVVLAVGVVLSALTALTLRRWIAGGRWAGVAPGPTASASGVAGRATRHERTRLRDMRRVLAVAAVLGGLGWILFPNIPVESDIDHFAGGLSELDDARHVEDVLGSSGQINVVVSGEDVLTPANVAWMRNSLDTLVHDHGDEVRPVLSPPALLSFLGFDASAEEIGAAWRLLPDYLTAATVEPDRRVGVLSFGIRVEDLAEVRDSRAAFVAAFADPPPGVDVEVVGLPLVLLRGEETISADRFAASLAGVAAAVAVLLVGLRRRADAMRALLAALLATGLGFLLVAVAGLSLSPITIALGALTTAVGCEFTVVLAESARAGRRRLRGAVGIAALTSAGGYLVLVASTLGVVREFGLLLTASVGLALVSSVLVVAATVKTPSRSPAVEPAQEPEIEKELSGV
jgi:predicted RND superfamily exporter protein